MEYWVSNIFNNKGTYLGSFNTVMKNGLGELWVKRDDESIYNRYMLEMPTSSITFYTKIYSNQILFTRLPKDDDFLEKLNTNRKNFHFLGFDTTMMPHITKS